MDFELEIQNLRHRVKALENPQGFPMYECPKPLETKDKQNPWLTAWANSNYPNLFGTNSVPPRTASDYEHTEEYVKPKPLETKELEVRLQRLAAYFTKRAKENTKRAEKLDWEVKNTFMRPDHSREKDNSAYYHSGKADTYLRAAGKVLETIALHINVSAPPPENPEKWIVECRDTDDKEWRYSAYNEPEPFASKEQAEDLYSLSKNKLEYRARRIDVSEKWVVEMADDNNWERSSNCPKVYDTKEEAEQAIVEHGSKSLKYRIVKENQ